MCVEVVNSEEGQESKHERSVAQEARNQPGHAYAGPEAARHKDELFVFCFGRVLCEYSVGVKCPSECKKCVVFRARIEILAFKRLID